MKRRLIIAVVSLLAVPAFAGLPRVAVMDLEDRTADRGFWVGVEGGTADMLTTAFVNTKKLQVVERAALAQVLAEQGLGQSGAVTPQTAAKIGRLLGVEYMVIGSVNQYGTKESDIGAFGVGVKSHSAQVGLDIRVIDTATAAIVTAATGQCSKTSRGLGISNADLLPTDVKIGSDRFATTLIGQAARGAVEDAAARVVAVIGGSWHGAVVRVTPDGLITISGGENAGVRVDDVFRIVRKGQDLVDPDTGEVLGSDDTLIGEIRVTEVKPKYANARLLSGGAVMANDRVERK